MQFPHQWASSPLGRPIRELVYSLTLQKENHWTRLAEVAVRLQHRGTHERAALFSSEISEIGFNWTANKADMFLHIQLRKIKFFLGSSYGKGPIFWIRHVLWRPLGLTREHRGIGLLRKGGTFDLEFQNVIYISFRVKRSTYVKGDYFKWGLKEN